MSIVEVTLSRDVDVRELAIRIGKDIGGVDNLETNDKTSVVAAINETYTAVNNIETSLDDVYAKKSELTPLATKAEVAEDIGNLADLQTTDKTNVVDAVNEVYNGASTAISELENSMDTTFAKKSELTPLATKAELTQAITDLIDGAGADSDTLKELADKITALAQADNGLVSAEAAQTFDEAQQQQARDNIGAISEADVNDILEAQSGGDYVDAYLQAGQ